VVLSEITGHRRNRRFVYQQYLGLFDAADAGDAERAAAECTQRAICQDCIGYCASQNRAIDGRRASG
jgi:hypothetical protein